MKKKTIMKTHKKDNQYLFKSIKTAYNKIFASKIEVADWQLKIMVPGTQLIWVAFDRREYRMQKLWAGEYNTLESFILGLSTVDSWVEISVTLTQT